MWVRIDADERAERRADDGHDQSGGGWGKPPPAHILRDLPRVDPDSLN